MTYTDHDPVEITLGICDRCDNYVPFIRLVTDNEDRVFQCLSCKAKHKQLVNGKITFKYLDELYNIRNAGGRE